jgi:hypothetical protein
VLRVVLRALASALGSAVGSSVQEQQWRAALAAALDLALAATVATRGAASGAGRRGVEDKQQQQQRNRLWELDTGLGGRPAIVHGKGARSLQVKDLILGFISFHESMCEPALDSAGSKLRGKFKTGMSYADLLLLFITNPAPSREPRGAARARPGALRCAALMAGCLGVPLARPARQVSAAETASSRNRVRNIAGLD